MRTSVIIIAHNEERFIGKCIESILAQTQKADEIILIAHNSIDDTLNIAQEYPIKSVSYSGPAGIIHARLEGLRHATGDIVLCLDGDSYADENWIAELSALLQKGNSLVGSWVKFKGAMFGSIASMFNKRMCVVKGERAAEWIWGPSFAFWGKDKVKIGSVYEKTEALSKRLGLSRNPEDHWLALLMSREGGLEVTNSTCVTTYTKERNSLESFNRTREDVRNGAAIRAYFKQHFGFDQ